MTLDRKVLQQQYFSIFTINQWVNNVDCDVVQLLKQYIVSIRRKIIKTPSVYELKQYLLDPIIYRQHYFYHNDIEWYIWHNYRHGIRNFETIIKSGYENNMSIHRVEVCFDNGCFAVADWGFKNFEPLFDHTVIHGEGCIKYYHNHPIVFVEK